MKSIHLVYKYKDMEIEQIILNRMQAEYDSLAEKYAIEDMEPSYIKDSQDSMSRDKNTTSSNSKQKEV